MTEDTPIRTHAQGKDRHACVHVLVQTHAYCAHCTMGLCEHMHTQIVQPVAH